MIKAPYNFVPLAQTVVFPDWAEKISMDIPFKDGISGTIDVSYTAQTPVFIGNGKVKGEDGKDTPVVRNYKAANGQYALPGSSLRGMLRNVIEIASFGKFCRIDDSILSHRDLHDKKYTNAFRNKNINAGWLVYDEEKKQWALYPVDYHRVKDSLLEKIYHPEKSFKERCEPQKRRESLNGNPVIYFELGKETADYINQKPFQCSIKGYTVLTGQPGSKKKDFIFEEKTSKKFDSIDELVRTFQGINEANPANQKKGYDLVAEWRDFQNNNYPGIPVFYLADSNGNPESLGLSQMYRLPYKNTLMDAVLHSSELHGEESKMDLSECIFGKIDNKKFSLRGRVQFEDAVGKNVSLDQMITTILGNPKPSFYPNYIEQKNAKDDYKTLMDSDARLRGWKRYPVRNETNPLEPDDRQRNVGTQFKPLKKDSVFEGKIHFYNLKPEELGALLWAITWNNNKELSHSIGMGKPYGFGQIKAEIKSLSFLENSTISNDYTEANAEQISSWQNDFSAYMESKVSNWKNSPQLKELFAMADSKNAKRQNWNLEHMKLGKPNEFVDAKKSREYLASYSSENQSLQFSGVNNSSNNNSRTNEYVNNKKGSSYGHNNSSKTIFQPKSEGGVVQGQQYTCILLEEKTKKGGWKAKVKSSESICGVIINTGAVPADKKTGDEITLKVKSVKGFDSMFEYIEK